MSGNDEDGSLDFETSNKADLSPKIKEEPSKKYGLIIKQKKPPHSAFQNVFKASESVESKDVKKEQKPPNVFGEDSDESDDHEERTVSQVNRNLMKRQSQSLASQKVQNTIQAALEQDSCVFQYDEVYDSMKQQQQRRVEEKKASDRTSKYAAELMRAAEKRKVMNELRVERSVQKERQLEGTQFADKESFLTESYKKKLAERAEMEREIKRDEALEARRSQKQEFSGFYRNYLDKVCRDGSEKLQVQNMDDEKQEETEERISIEQADTLANIKKGGLILPGKKRPANIRKRSIEANERKEESSDEENSAPASKIREMQYQQQKAEALRRPRAHLSESGNSNEGCSDSGSGSEDDLSEAEESVSPVQPYKPLPQVLLKDPEQERSENLERRVKRIVKMFERRNTEESIGEARQRYLARRRSGLVRPVFYKD